MSKRLHLGRAPVGKEYNLATTRAIKVQLHFHLPPEISLFPPRNRFCSRSSIKLMTEYDFSPETYQAHLENMNRISRWVDRTEGHRAEFGNAAALVENQFERTIRDSSPSPSPERRRSFDGRRKVPPPLPLHPCGTPMKTGQFGMSPYASPMYSGDDRNLGFVYSHGQISPGTMPMYIYGHPSHPMPMPHSAGVQIMTMAPPVMSPAPASPPPSLPHHHHGHFRRSRANSFSITPPTHLLAVPLSGGYAQATPNAVIVPPISTRHHRLDRHLRGRPPVSYVVSP
ncbi:hypothetical protein H2248_000254 [Termitomyces sp. 'cryptogamus']|nr:hypothetical protein H2248_000254 [Termitomyces sp. 'cryptogamus']